MKRQLCQKKKNKKKKRRLYHINQRKDCCLLLRGRGKKGSREDGREEKARPGGCDSVTGESGLEGEERRKGSGTEKRRRGEKDVRVGGWRRVRRQYLPP